MIRYQRNLPQWHPENGAIFLTWRLHGAWVKFQKADFAAFDRILDTTAAGPRWLEEPAIAQCVVDAFRFGERELNLYTLIAFCVMPNHVHLVVEPRTPLAKIAKSIKFFTARNANQTLGRTGERFWQDESYDRWIRNPNQLNQMVEFTESNPVTAGLSQAPEEWPWSSASHAFNAQLLSVL